MKMPFGKFKGYPLDQIPDDYLAWVLDNCTNLTDTLREAIREQLGLNDRGRRTLAPNCEMVMQVWHKQMTQAYSPANGGSDEAMRVVEEGYALLRQLVLLWPWG